MTVTTQRIIPACVGGWNARDPLAIMPEIDAKKLVNILPEQSLLEIRKGCALYATAGAGDIKKLFTYNAQDGTSDLIACGNTKIYDATAGGAATQLATGFASDDWQAIAYKGRLFFVNGTDTPQTYNGTTVTSSGWTGSGLTATNLISGTHYKERFYFIEKNTAKLWYSSSAGIVTGALTELNLETYLRKGGKIVAVGTYSDNLGSGLEDLLAIVSSQGEILIFYGDYPAATNWTITSRHVTPKPCGDGYNSTYQINGDLLIFTESGIYPLSIITSSPKLFDTEDSIASKVNKAISKYATEGAASSVAWDITLFPNGRFMLVNVPISATISQQFIVNMLSGAWSLFTGFNAFNWAAVGSDLYYSTANGEIYRYEGYSDNDSEINWEIEWAPNYLGSDTKEKAIKEVLPIIISDSPFSFAFGADADFEDSLLTANSSIATGTGADWDTSDWESSEWGGYSIYNKDRFNVPAFGSAISFKMKGSTKDVFLQIIALKVLFELGGSR